MNRYILLIILLTSFVCSGIIHASSEEEDFIKEFERRIAEIAKEHNYTFYSESSPMVQLPSSVVEPSLEAEIIDFVQEGLNPNRALGILKSSMLGGKIYNGPWSINEGIITGPYFGASEETKNSTIAPFNVSHSKSSHKSRKISFKKEQKMVLNVVNKSNGYKVICSLYRQGNKDKLQEWELSKGQNISKEIIPVTEDGRYYVRVSTETEFEKSGNHTLNAYGMLQVID